MRPGEGERRAIGGYYPQYRIAASLILRHLQNDSLQWIRVADPDAGRVDDLQVGSQARVDAFQVKWHMYGGTFTFNDLSAPSGDSPSLISQLADGWQRLQDIYPGQRIVVHLVTNVTPSTADGRGIPVGAVSPTPRHFAALIEQVWKPVGNTSPSSAYSIPGEWQDAWDAIKRASGLSASDFEIFIHDCELEFGYSLPGIGEASTRDDNIMLRDLKDLTETLFGTVADPQKIIELSYSALLVRLNWQARFEFRSRHEFPVNELLYQPIEHSVNQLEQSLDTLSGGYIAVLGTPGSGKSSLLTQTLRMRMERVIKYYAYVPDAQDPITVRGESVSFLHDIVLALKYAGFSLDNASASSFDRDQLLQHLHLQLHELHKDWQATGRKTIILIDGLDHISREQHPNRSLLYDLPQPEQIPEGIFFVLGSQTDQLMGLPAQVQYTIRQASRRIEMQPLSRKSVLEIIARASLMPDLSTDQKSQVYTLSSGHPLALAYLLQHLAGASNAAEQQNILDMTEQYEGDIEKIYYSYWQDIEHKYELTHLLGLLARLRRIIDLSWIRSWANHAVVDQLNRTLAHYFRREDHDRWYFFHNSFRLFLLKKTSESYPEIFDAARNRELHHELAEQCAKSQPLSLWSWEELYHRLSADEHDFVLQRATPSWFREQLFAFRPISSIRADIQLALRSATLKQNPIALVRLLLTVAEMDQRASHLEHTSFIPLLFSLEKEQIVAEHVRDGKQLRVDRETALQISYDLKLRGFEEEARRIFELAEPLELLMSPHPIERTLGTSQNDQDTLLEAWTRAASQFRNVGQIIATIRQLRRQEDEHRRYDAKTITHLLQSFLLFTLGDVLLAQQRWDDLSLLYKAFLMDRKADQRQKFQLQLYTIDAYIASGEEKLAQQLLEHTIQEAKTLHIISAQAQVALAERIYRVNGDLDLIRVWVGNLPQPELATAINPDLGLRPFLYRFCLNRLLYTLGSQASPKEVVPDAQDPNQQGMVYFERAICIIARLWSDGWRDRKMDKETFVNEIRPILQFFSWHQNTNRQWNLWYVIKEARAEFFTLLVKAAEQHGFEVVEELRLAFEREWDNPEKQKNWPTDVRRQIIIAFWNIGIPTDWAITRLRSLEPGISSSNHVFTRLQEYEKQIEAWITLGETNMAYQLLTQWLQASFTIGNEKDYQLDTWIDWLKRINCLEPDKAPQRIAWFTRSILAVEANTEGSAAQYAAQNLLSATFEWSPRCAVHLFQWFQEKHIIRHETGLRTLLYAALEKDYPPIELILACLISLNIPFATEPDAKLIALLIEKAKIWAGVDTTLTAAKHLFACIQRDALPSRRSKWSQGLIQGLKVVGIDTGQVSPSLRYISIDKEEALSEKLELKDGSQMELDEVNERVNTIEDLQKILEAAKSDSYFDWKPIVARLVAQAENQDLLRLVDLIRERRRPSLILSLISKRLLALGYRNDAISIGKLALEASEPIGWDQWYGGGTRLTSLEVLVQANPTLGRSLVYKTLQQDIATHPYLPKHIILNLSQILSLLLDTIPTQAVWNEIEQYIYTLFIGTRIETYDECDLVLAPSLDTSELAMADLVGIHIGHPTNVINQASQVALAGLLIRKNHAIGEVTKELLTRREIIQEQLLAVLEAVNSQEPSALLPLQKQIGALHQSPNYAIRTVAHSIYHPGVKNSIPMLASISTLSPIYSLELPPQGRWSLTGHGEITSLEPAPDTQDPVEIVRPFDIELSFIAQMANLEPVNVCYRAVQIMKQLEPYETWAAGGEKELREHLEAIGIRFPFVRPRTNLARRAMFHVLIELTTAGVFTTKSLTQLEQFLRFYDPNMLLIQPEKRPFSIPPITERDWYRADEHNWLDQVDEVTDYICTQIADQRIVLAEKTHLQVLGNTIFEEIRQSMICTTTTPKPSVLESWDQFFLTAPRCLISEYEYLPYFKEPVSFIFQKAHRYDSPGDNWLALNPAIGRQLGWHYLENEGLFRWVDDNDDVMVESVWWKDGPMGWHGSHDHDETGEGWLVVASQEAFSQIRNRYSFLKRQIMVERECYGKERQSLRRYTLRDTPVPPLL